MWNIEAVVGSGQGAESVGVLGSAVAELQAREDEVAREWEWLNEAVNRVARAMSDDDDVRDYGNASLAATDAFRLLQHRAMAVGQRRVELRLRLAVLERAHRVG